MSQQEKAHYFRILKDAGIQFDKHYREYNTEELKVAYSRLVEDRPELAQTFSEPIAVKPTQPSFEDLANQAQAQREAQRAQEAQNTVPNPTPAGPARAVPRGEADPNEIPGMRLNTHGEDEPIRVDEQGRVWYQEEVLKPGYAKPRGRRVLQYTDRGVQQQTVKNGDFIETFEIDGPGAGRTAEIKITLPSYQTGIYKDPRFPFKVHTYNGNEGFDFAAVADYYGGLELVPPSIKRIYVENVLCFDMRTTIQTIQAEYRQLQLTGRIQ